MKILFFLVFLLTGIQHGKYWSCMQIGYQDNIPVVVISDIQTIPYENYKVREQNFSKIVKKVLKISGTYDPICHDSDTKIEAEEINKFIIKKAKDVNLTVLPINILTEE